MLARRQFMGVTAGALGVAGLGSVLGPSGATPAPRRASPWTDETWTALLGSTLRTRDPQGRVRRLKVEAVGSPETQPATTGASFIVMLTSTAFLTEGIYAVTAPSTGTFSAFLSTGTLTATRSASLVVNRVRPV